MKRGDLVMLTEDGVRWMAANPKLHARWRDRRGVIESNSRSGWHRVRWDGNKSSTEAIPAKFLLSEALEAARAASVSMFNGSFGPN
ncbi:hypothetical protein [Bradyrhizobium sp. RDM4]|uniref:hypothetical protein n=1 Tax=Bradyrhizobium sp. RDM4 TaxID=3378765 RepID=UPI0038FC53B5